MISLLSLQPVISSEVDREAIRVAEKPLVLIQPTFWRWQGCGFKPLRSASISDARTRANPSG